VAIPAQQYRDLHNALAAVQVNAQAIAAADLTIGTLTAARERFSSWSLDNARRWAAQQLDDALGDVRRFRQPFEGMPQSPVADATWDDLRKAIGRGYNVCWSIIDTIGSDSEWSATVSWLAEAAVGTIQAMPGVIQAALSFTSEIVTDTVGGVAAGLLPLWPLVVVAGVLAIAGAVVVGYGRKKGVLR
jgi:hypothetical protein